MKKRKHWGVYGMSMIEYQKKVERWDVLEISCQGPSDQNPFIDYHIKGIFKHKNEVIEADGFYDGEGTYKVRFMPSFVGGYTFEITANFLEGGLEGAFEVMPAKEGNHGPVRVANGCHFAYEDGTPYYSIGTTCYVWNLQSDERIAETLETLKNSAFNKIRFCIFPKHYDYNLGEPRSYPYEGTQMDSSVLTKQNFNQYNGKAEGNNWDFTRFNVEHFQHIEKCILALRELGIEADLIVMHPYDRWGFSCMKPEEDDLYWKYVIARFSSYRNVWWSLANEFDLMKEKTIQDWERYADIICTKDPYNHLRSIHNCRYVYDYSRPWVTHCSVQKMDAYKTAELVDEWRERYKKPVIMDEMCYEGNIQHGWGNISGEEMLRRFWETVCRGGYPGHGETYMHPEEILWWSHGGKLHGESHKRFKFLYDVMQNSPGFGFRFAGRAPGAGICTIAENSAGKTCYLYYYSFMRPSFEEVYIDEDTEFEVEVLDTWETTITKMGTFKGRFKVELSGKPYMAIRLTSKEA